MRGASSSTPASGSTSAVLAGLFLMSIALGYQLDKLELVYSDRGIATGVSYTDQHAQFLAYDVLTGPLGDRRGAPGRRRVRPASSGRSG